MKKAPHIDYWITLNEEVRQKLIQTFGIKKSTSRQVKDNVFITDGVLQNDLDRAMHIGEMISFLSDEWHLIRHVPLDDLADTLLEASIAKLYGRSVESVLSGKNVEYDSKNENMASTQTNQSSGETLVSSTNGASNASDGQSGKSVSRNKKA